MPGHVDPTEPTPLAPCRVHPIGVQQTEINGERLQDVQLYVKHPKATDWPCDHLEEDYREGWFCQVPIQEIEHQHSHVNIQ